jgi:hypothetical protein
MLRRVHTGEGELIESLKRFLLDAHKNKSFFELEKLPEPPKLPTDE